MRIGKPGRWIAVASGAVALLTTVSALAQSVVVYSAVSPKLMTAFVDEFQKQNPGIKVELISGGSGELLTRLKAEKARPRADVLVGPDADNFDAYLDLFESYKSKEDGAFPRSAVGPDNKYYGFSTNFQAFIVNTKMMPADKAPQSWSDLAKPEYKGKVVMANPGAVGLGLLADATDPAALQLGHDGQDHRRGDVRDELAACLPERREGRDTCRPDQRVQHRREPGRRLPRRRRLPEGRHRADQRRERHHQGRAQYGQREEVPRLRQLQGRPPDDRRDRQAAQCAQRRGAARRPARRQDAEDVPVRLPRRRRRIARPISSASTRRSRPNSSASFNSRRCRADSDARRSVGGRCGDAPPSSAACTRTEETPDGRCRAERARPDQAVRRRRRRSHRGRRRLLRRRAAASSSRCSARPAAARRRRCG